MIRLRNRDTGGDMWVHESRLDEYLAAGHRLAAAPADKVSDPDTGMTPAEPIKTEAPKTRKKAGRPKAAK